MNARLIQPGVPQHVTPDQAIGAIMRQMEQVHHSLNLISIKVQTLQNALVNKGAIAVPELEKEWNALVDEMKTAARASIVTPEGVPLATKEEPKKEEETHGGILALSHPDHTPAGPVAGVAASAPQVDTKPVATTPELQPTPVAVPGHAA